MENNKMMSPVYYVAHNAISPIGFGLKENSRNLFANNSGIVEYNNSYFLPEKFCASIIDEKKLNRAFGILTSDTNFTRFEKMMLCSVNEALEQSNIDVTSNETLLIISSTKGNIDLLEESKKHLFAPDRVYLWESARVVSEFIGNPNKPVIVSHACISGLVAQLIAKRYIESGQYKNVVVIGCDMVTPFVASGFQSFKALSPNPCSPFDKNRDGLSLGEGAATVILSSDKKNIKSESVFSLEAGSITNDANHISGPSRTGEGLFLAIQNILKQNPVNIDYISAHGTATIYNDEMESIAISRAKLLDVPVNSYKGYIGHTLGAAGVIETVLTLESMKNNELVKSLGFKDMGVSHYLNVIENNTPSEINTCLKIASGFGGCNAALLIKKQQL